MTATSSRSFNDPFSVERRGLSRRLRRLVATLLSILILEVAPPWSSPSRADGYLEVEVGGVLFDHATGAPVVMLESEETGRALPIWVGAFEAQAIAMELEGVVGQRPLTHDLMKDLVEELDAEVDRVVVNDLRGNTYHATIHLRGPTGVREVDSRPSDAIALALRFRKPIFVSQDLMSGDGALEINEEPAPVMHLWGLTLQDVTLHLAEVFSLADGEGVLVSDVAADAVAGVVKRGDVIRAVRGEPIRSLADLRSHALDLERELPIRLLLTREGVSVAVEFGTIAR